MQPSKVEKPLSLQVFKAHRQYSLHRGPFTSRHKGKTLHHFKHNDKPLLIKKERTNKNPNYKLTHKNVQDRMVQTKIILENK